MHSLKDFMARPCSQYLAFSRGFSKGLNAVPLERKSIHIRGLPPRDSGEQLASGYVV